jgi:hypothetical protein
MVSIIICPMTVVDLIVQEIRGHWMVKKVRLAKGMGVLRLHYIPFRAGCHVST